MSITYPSSLLTILDLPEPKNITIEFVYNFFTPDEKRNSSGDDFNLAGADLFEAYQIRSIPRSIKLSWSSVTINGLDGNEKNASRSGAANIFNADNLKMIQSEQVFSNFSFVAVNFQDNAADGKLFSMISGSTDMRGITNGSVTDAAKKLGETTRKEVNGKHLVMGFNSQTKRGMLKTSPTPKSKKHDSETENKFKELKELSFKTQINNKHIGSIVKRVASDVTSTFADEMFALLKMSTSIQESAINDDDSTSSAEWDTGFVSIVTKKMSTADSSSDVSEVNGVGFIVERDEIADGSIVETRQFTVDGISSTSLIDPEVRYGATYRYRIKSIAAVSLPGSDSEGNLSIFTGLVSSQMANSTTVTCVEMIPPPPPADFKPTWDYDNGCVRLTWSFPVNSQRDIKRFQVFRRSNTDEAFTLLAEYNFDDSLDPTPSDEEVDVELVKRDDPSTLFLDREFRKDDTKIYTLCCIDAHGLTSNYSTQFEVKFDRFKNRIVIREISKSGAPKAFPNMFLEERVFVDTIKTSGFSKMKVYFDPSYLNVTDNEGSDLNLLPTDPGAVFRFQMINADVQIGHNVDVDLNDIRKL